MTAAVRCVGPSQFAAALALAIANRVFVLLTYLGAWWPIPLPLWLLALVATVVAVIVSDRGGHRLRAWALLVIGYGLVAAWSAVQPDSRSYLLIDLTMSHAIALAVLLADRRVARGKGRPMTYVGAVMAGVATGAVILALVLHLAPDVFRADDGWTEERTLPHFLDLYVGYMVLYWLLFGGAAVVLYGQRRVAEHAVRRLHAAQLERLARSRQITESRLQLMQARIEPQFLFNTLERVKGLYASEPQWAEYMLDELGAFLRAAMPQMRETYSTLGREAELVRAFLAILGIHLRDRLTGVIEVTPDVTEAPLPSMMLLPLVDQVVAGALGSSTGRVHIWIRATQEDDRMRLVVRSTGAAPAKIDEAAIASIEERLLGLYRGAASLALSLDAGSGAVEASVEIPLERYGSRRESQAA